MARLLQHFIEAPRRCSYLPRETAALEHRVLVDVSGEDLEKLLERGWRRFGPDYFRPACERCDSCVSTRLDVLEFSPSKSQRRAARACQSLRTEVGPPRVDPERLALYHAWHASREAERGWPPANLDVQSYYATFAFPHAAAREVGYRDEANRLVAVAITDQTPRALSLVYFFYDPSWARASIGIANIVRHVEMAKQLGLRHVYLGYRVTDCPSMRYKMAFLPQETMCGRPPDRALPDWVRKRREV